MSGTKEGGIKCRDENKRKYGEDFYKKIGAKGGAKKVKKGFALMDKSKVAAIGARGGRISKRGKAVN